MIDYCSAGSLIWNLEEDANVAYSEGSLSVKYPGDRQTITVLRKYGMLILEEYEGQVK